MDNQLCSAIVKMTGELVVHLSFLVHTSYTSFPCTHPSLCWVDVELPPWFDQSLTTCAGLRLQATAPPPAPWSASLPTPGAATSWR